MCRSKVEATRAEVLAEIPKGSELETKFLAFCAAMDERILESTQQIQRLKDIPRLGLRGQYD